MCYSCTNDVLIVPACSIVYDVTATNNEEMSAELFMEFSQECLKVRCTVVHYGTYL